MLEAKKLLDTRGKYKEKEAKEEPPKDHMVAGSGERNKPHGKDLECHSSHGKRPTDVAGLHHYCPTHHVGVMIWA